MYVCHCAYTVKTAVCAKPRCDETNQRCDETNHITIVAPQQQKLALTGQGALTHNKTSYTVYSMQLYMRATCVQHSNRYSETCTAAMQRTWSSLPSPVTDNPQFIRITDKNIHTLLQIIYN